MPPTRTGRYSQSRPLTLEEIASAAAFTNAYLSYRIEGNAHTRYEDNKALRDEAERLGGIVFKALGGSDPANSHPVKTPRSQGNFARQQQEVPNAAIDTAMQTLDLFTEKADTLICYVKGKSTNAI